LRVDVGVGACLLPLCVHMEKFRACSGLFQQGGFSLSQVMTESSVFRWGRERDVRILGRPAEGGVWSCGSAGLVAT